MFYGSCLLTQKKIEHEYYIIDFFNAHVPVLMDKPNENLLRLKLTKFMNIIIYYDIFIPNFSVFFFVHNVFTNSL